jgi:methylenetetrahydrofolate dehydrogenase (NADP+)/methenyltetrahydrofolate cyclohydrolase
MALLAEYRIELDGADAVVVGRDRRQADRAAPRAGGRDRHDRHSHARSRRPHAGADVWWSPPGGEFITAEMVNPGAAVIDVGINRTDTGLVGDVDPGAVEVAGYLTPVPGGVGPMTIACLLENAVICARMQTR